MFMIPDLFKYLFKKNPKLRVGDYSEFFDNYTFEIFKDELGFPQIIKFNIGVIENYDLILYFPVYYEDEYSKPEYFIYSKQNIFIKSINSYCHTKRFYNIINIFSKYNTISYFETEKEMMKHIYDFYLNEENYI